MVSHSGFLQIKVFPKIDVITTIVPLNINGFRFNRTGSTQNTPNGQMYKITVKVIDFFFFITNYIVIQWLSNEKRNLSHFGLTTNVT